MTTRRDVVIIGGGHNGLAAAAYLARAGLDVEVLERLDTVGGAAVSRQGRRAAWEAAGRLSVSPRAIAVAPRRRETRGVPGVVSEAGLQLGRR